jgi:hypothetical protein
MIIQTILLDRSAAVWTDEASNVSSLDPTGADQIDASICLRIWWVFACARIAQSIEVDAVSSAGLRSDISRVG